MNSSDFRISSRILVRGECLLLSAYSGRYTAAAAARNPSLCFLAVLSRPPSLSSPLVNYLSHISSKRRARRERREEREEREREGKFIF